MTSEEALVAADDANKTIHLSWIAARTPGMTVLADDDLTIVDSGLDTDTFNVVCRSRLEDETIEGRIEAATDYFRSVQRPFAWWIGPADRPERLGEILSRKGLVAAGTEPAMWVELSRVAPAPPLPAGLRIERATTREQIGQVARVLAGLVDPPMLSILRYFELGAPALLSPACPLVLYVGYLDGEAVASAELTIGGGVAGLYNIATSTRQRGKGIGTAMTIRTLQDARAMGVETAVLQASEDGFPIYSRIGFVVKGSFTEYHPEAPRTAVADC
jgi:ribosomal protein S18 acetylase RimI-like enzyme